MADPRPTADDDAAILFAALGDPTRLRLIRRLGSGETQPITQLAEGFPQTRQAITRHLLVLRDAGVVEAERVGREHLYRLRPQGLLDGREYLDRATAQWDDALHRLQRFIATDATRKDQTS